MVIGKKVAIKRLRVHIQADQDFAKLLARELHVWSKLNHINVLPLLGYVLEGNYPSIVSEWIENGTVRKYLAERPDTDPIPLIMGIARGVEYLHKQNVIHSDLKADNVLVGSAGEPLICDFGISRMLTSSLTLDETSTGGLKGSVRWTAFELLDMNGDPHHTKETDVWAFGMTIYEILTRRVPYSRLKYDVPVMHAIRQGEVPPFPDNVDHWAPKLQFICKICGKCWVSSSQFRITMEHVAASLCKIDVVKENSGHSQQPCDNGPTLTSSTYLLASTVIPDYPSSSDVYSNECTTGTSFLCQTAFTPQMTLSPHVERDCEPKTLRDDSLVQYDQENQTTRGHAIGRHTWSPSTDILNAQNSDSPLSYDGVHSRLKSLFRQSDADASPYLVRRAYRALGEPDPTFHIPQGSLQRPSAARINTLLEPGSEDSAYFDLRLPYATVRKGWDDWEDHDINKCGAPACTPNRTRMHIYAHIAGPEWITDVRPRTSKHITVEDVLVTICDAFSAPVDHARWVRDSADPNLADRVDRAYRRRVEAFRRHMPELHEKTRRAGLLRVDYLGSKYFFAGLRLCHDSDGSEQWMVEVDPAVC